MARMVRRSETQTSPANVALRHSCGPKSFLSTPKVHDMFGSRYTSAQHTQLYIYIYVCRYAGRFWNRTEPPRNRPKPLQRTARNRPVNRTVPSTCSVFPCMTGGTRASTGFRHFQAQTCTPAQHPQPCLLLLREATNAGCFPHHTETAHDLYSPALPRAHGGVQIFSTFKPQTFQNLYSPASAAQHPQPCLLLLRRSNECRLPSAPYRDST